MKYLKVTLEGWTASFRKPEMISGKQLTLPVPPLSTVYGLLGAAKGEIVTPADTNLGYVFEYEAKTLDKELIYEIKGLKGNKSNVVLKEFLYHPKMYLYLDNLEFKEYLENPRYTLRLGRSEDLVQILKVETVELEERNNISLGKTLLPLSVEEADGEICSFASYTVNDHGTQYCGVKPYIVAEEYFNYSGTCLYDQTLDKGIWIHEA